MKLTDGVDDAAVSVASTVQGGQISDSLLSQTVLWKEIIMITYELLFIVSHIAVAYSSFLTIQANLHWDCKTDEPREEI